MLDDGTIARVPIVVMNHVGTVLRFLPLRDERRSGCPPPARASPAQTSADSLCPHMLSATSLPPDARREVSRSLLLSGALRRGMCFVGAACGEAARGAAVRGVA